MSQSLPNCESVQPLYSPRREFLKNFGLGFGGVALSTMLADEPLFASPVTGAVRDMSPRETHFPAKSEIGHFSFSKRWGSQMDLFDPKPELSRRNGRKRRRYAVATRTFPAMSR